MSAVGFGFLNFIILILVVLALLVLVVGGAVGLRRSPDSIIKAVSIAAIIIGALLLLGLVFSTVIGVEPFVFLPFLLVLLGAFSFIVWAATLADCAVNEPSQDNDKIVWVIIIVFTHIVGAVLYLAVRRPQRIAETGK